VKKFSAKTPVQRYRQAEIDQKRANRGPVIRAGAPLRMLDKTSNASVCDAANTCRDTDGRLWMHRGERAHGSIDPRVIGRASQTEFGF
jgi:hypothetical protein